MCTFQDCYLAEFHRTVNILVDVEEKNHCSALILFYYLEKTGNPLSKEITCPQEWTWQFMQQYKYEKIL